MQHQHHPWREMGRLVDWTVRFVELPLGLLGLTVWATHEVLLDRDLYQNERRSTIEHERQHILRGPSPWGCDDPREERAVREAAARALLPDVREIADALIWAQGRITEAAEELWVDEATLRDRLDHMHHPAEKAILQQRLQEHPPWA